MSQFLVRDRAVHAVRHAAVLALLALHAGCGEGGPTEQPTPEPLPDAGVQGVSNANVTVCARNEAGTTWCTRTNAEGGFRITHADAAPGTGTGDLPASGIFTVYTVDCPAGGRTVDRGGAQRNGGTWLDVRCTPDGCMAAPAGLLAWYRFDETAGDSAADFANAAGASPLRLLGGRHAAGRVLGGLELDSDTYAQGTSDKNLGTGDFSIAFWMRLRPESASAFASVIDKRDEWPIRGYHIAVSGGEPLIQLADAGEFNGWYNYHSEMGGAFADGQWHHLAVTVQRASTTGLRWYLDGAPVGTVADPTGRQGSLNSAAPLLVGGHSFYSGGGLDGTVDELQIVGRALAAAEISALHTRHACR